MQHRLISQGDSAEEIAPRYTAEGAVEHVVYVTSGCPVGCDSTGSEYTNPTANRQTRCSLIACLFV
jgi:hypothetical protein